MKSITLPVGSKQYLFSNVKAYDVSGNITNPTGAVVNWAFTTNNADPQDTDWKTGDWQTGSSPTGDPIYYARIMVGPGTSNVFITNTQYAIWLKVNGVTEIPVFLLGSLQVV